MKKTLNISLTIISILLFAGIIFLSITSKPGDSELSEKENVVPPMKEPIAEASDQAEKEAAENKEKKVKPKKVTEKKSEPEKEMAKEKESEKSSEDSKSEVTEEPTQQPKKEKPKNKKAYTEENHSGSYYVTSEMLNYRAGAGTNFDVVGSLKNGQEIHVTKKTSNGWYGFENDGKVVYSSANLLSKDQPKKEEPKKKVAKDEQPKKKTPKDEKPTEDKSETNKTVADQLNGVDNNSQLILVTTNGYSTSNAQIRTFERDANGNWQDVLNVSGFIGKNGFANNKKEGDGKSPTGKYSIGHGFGYQGNPGMKYSFKDSTSNDVWVDDVHSKYYNTWQTKDNKDKDWNSAEEMTHRLYNYGFTINYNTNQTPGKGSAIFFHVGTSYTVGCTAMGQSNLVSVMKWVDPNKNPVIIQTPVSELGNY